jgi:hypothetical protein
LAISPRSLVPLAHVADVARSIAFYGRLGLTVRNTFVPPGQTDPSWAWLESGGARLMVARADLPLTPESEGVLFYIYVDDVAAARAAWRATESPSAPSRILSTHPAESSASTIPTTMS